MAHFDHGAAALLPLAVAIPMLGAAAMLALGRHVARLVRDLFAIAIAAGVTGLSGYFLAVASSGRIVNWVATWTPIHHRSVGIVLEVDPMGAGIALLAAGLVTCALIFSVRYLESDTGHFHLLVLCFLAGMEGFALTGDLFDLFVFLELMGASAYALTALEIEDPQALQGGLNFGIINSLGAYVSLMGIGLLYAKTGVLQLALLGAKLAGHRPGPLVIAAFVLIFTGLLVKSGVVPFHFWLADAHAVAPAPVCMLFSAVMDPLGVYAAFRVYWTVFSPTIAPAHARVAFLSLGVATAVIGAVMSCAQRHIKRMLAYSTIAHVGLFFCALGLLREDGTAAAALYAAGHAGIKGALFLLCGMLLDRHGNVDELHLFGKGRRSPHLGLLFGLCGFALAGLPPLGLALGKALAEKAAIDQHLYWMVALFVLVSALTGGAVLRVTARVFLGLGDRPKGDAEYRAVGTERPPAKRLQALPAAALSAIGVLIAGTLALGVLPGARDAAARAAAAFVDRSGYLANALGHAGHRLAIAPSAPNWDLRGVLLGIASALLAAGFAAASCYGRRVLVHAPALRLGTRAVLRALHRVHSGHIGDYVAWLMAGCAILAGLIGLPLR